MKLLNLVVAVGMAVVGHLPDVLSQDSTSQTTPGLAIRYPADEGIASDPAVLFHDDFESGDSKSAEPGDKWHEVNRRLVSNATDQTAPLQFETNAKIVRGKKSARVQLRQDGYEDVTLVKWLQPGHDELYMRYCVRYGTDYGYHGHGGGGFMADAGKGGFKGAGKAPDGDKFFWATLEPIGPRQWDPPGALIFYAYWWKMKPDGRGSYWGNWFQPPTDQVPQLETWTCIEWRVKANSAGQDNGELDCWIDGQHCGEFREINWRSTDSLKVNKVQLSLWLEPSGYARAGGGTTRTVWYDDIVVATQYIGPKK
jgi:hypothetical protein